MLANNYLLGHKSNKLPLDLKSIGHIPKTYLLKVSFDLLLTGRLGQWVCHIQHGVESLHLDELLLEVFACDMKSSLYMLGLLVRPWLLSKGYGVVVVAVQYNGI